MYLKNVLLTLFLAVAVHAQEDAAQTLQLIVSDRTASVVIGEEWDLHLSLTGTLATRIILVPECDPPKAADTIFPVQNVTIEPGIANWETNVSVKGRQAGHVTIVWKVMVADTEENVTINTDDAFTSFTVIRSGYLDIVGYVIGWTYFVFWSVSYWPQFCTNWKRQSVVGLNFDYVGLNILGNTAYIFFTCFLYWSPLVRAQYKAIHPHGVLQVEINDVVYTIHGAVMSIATGVQCCIYQRGKQKMSWTAIGFTCAAMLILTGSVISVGLEALTWLSVLYICSYIKLSVTVVKYFPQAFMNYKRKSTEGWSITAMLLDFSGGISSILQMFLLAFNSDDWNSLIGNPTKLLLGLISVLYDVVFITQHYVIYRPRHSEPKKLILSVP